MYKKTWSSVQCPVGFDLCVVLLLDRRTSVMPPWCYQSLIMNLCVFTHTHNSNVQRLSFQHLSPCFCLLRPWYKPVKTVKLRLLHANIWDGTTSGHRAPSGVQMGGQSNECVSASSFIQTGQHVQLSDRSCLNVWHWLLELWWPFCPAAWGRGFPPHTIAGRIMCSKQLQLKTSWQ